MNLLLSVFILSMFSGGPDEKPITRIVKDVPVDFIIPKDCKGAILILPGWGFNRSRWCEESSLCKKALKEGYALILPEMNKSVYSSAFFKETREDYKLNPDLNWVNNELIPYCNKEFSLLRKGDKNFIIGLSTGGRGVALVVLSNKDLFTAAAALSGDYDQSLMPTDKLIEGYYGIFSLYSDRWKNVDNPFYKVNEWNTPIYLGHGANDKIVPADQTKVFYNVIKKSHPDLPVKLHLAEGKGHDFDYWDSEVDPVLDFFKEFR